MMRRKETTHEGEYYFMLLLCVCVGYTFDDMCGTYTHSSQYTHADSAKRIIKIIRQFDFTLQIVATDLSYTSSVETRVHAERNE